LRTGDRSARGVAQDAPFLIAARLERRAGALTKAAERHDFTFARKSKGAFNFQCSSS
jgi:hypothetical protein